MMKKSVLIIGIIGILLLIGIVSIAIKERITEESIKNSIQRFASQSLGSLCSGEESCKEFCLNNRGKCEDYCKGNENELCKTIFSDNNVQQNKETTNINPDINRPGQAFYECQPKDENDHRYYRTDETLVIDYIDTNTIYVAVEWKGVFKTTNVGETWQKITKGIKSYARSDNPNEPCYPEMAGMVMDPTNNNRLLVTGPGSPGRLGGDLHGENGGLYETLDAGMSWHQLAKDWMNGYTTNSIVIDSTNPSTIYYGTSSLPASYNEADPNKIFVTKGIVYKTTDSGRNWEELPTGFLGPMAATGIYLDTKNPKQLLVATFGRVSRDVQITKDQLGFLHSDDGGETWTSLLGNMPKEYGAVRNSDVSSANFKHIFASLAGEYDKSFYSLDGGQTFKATDKYVYLASFDPFDSEGNHLLGYNPWGMEKKLLESSDGGATWQPTKELPKEILNSNNDKIRISNIVWDPKDKNTIYLSGSGGYVWKSTDNGKTWQTILNVEMLK